MCFIYLFILLLKTKWWCKTSMTKVMSKFFHVQAEGIGCESTTLYNNLLSSKEKNIVMHACIINHLFCVNVQQLGMVGVLFWLVLFSAQFDQDSGEPFNGGNHQPFLISKSCFRKVDLLKRKNKGIPHPFLYRSLCGFVFLY